jgi:hypothetical protein
MDISRQPFVPPKSSWDLTRKPKDEIVEEIHEWRQSYAAKFDFDLDRMFTDLKSKEALNPAPRVQGQPLEPKPPNPV